jgi:hypothetical protein
LLDSFAAPVAGPGVIAPVHFGSDGPDRVAWVSRDSGGNTSRLDLVRRASPQLEGPVTPQYTDVVAMAAADYDSDGDEDLVMTHAADRLAWVYDSGSAQNTTRVFSATRSKAIDDEQLDPEGVLPNASTFVFRDLDNDKQADLLLPVQTSYATSFEVLSTVYRSAATSFDVFDCNAVFDLNASQSPYTATFSMESTDFDPLDEMTHVQIVVWSQEDGTTALTPTADAPAQYFTINPTQFQGEVTDIWPLTDVEIPLESGDTACTMPIRWIEVRLVKMAETGIELLDSGPTYTIALVTRPEDFCDIDVSTNYEMNLSTVIPCEGTASCWSGQPLPGSTPPQAITRNRKTGPPSGVTTSVNLGDPHQTPVTPQS